MTRTKEELENEIKLWDGLNKYIVRQAKAELRELENKPEIEVIEEKDEMDINNDGKVDAKDKSLAGRILASRRRKKNK